MFKEITMEVDRSTVRLVTSNNNYLLLSEKGIQLTTKENSTCFKIDKISDENNKSHMLKTVHNCAPTACPFHAIDDAWCKEMNRKIDDKVREYFPPEWCPLRSHPIMIQFR